MPGRNDRPGDCAYNIHIGESGMKIGVRYDTKADALYLFFSDSPPTHSKQLDLERTVGYSDDGEILNIRFSEVSSGINTNDLPHRSAIGHALAERGFIRVIEDQLERWIPGASYRKSKMSVEPHVPVSMKTRIVSSLQIGMVVIVFAASIVASILLSRNLFVLNSLVGLEETIFALVIALSPVVFGCLISVAWLMHTYNQAKS